MNEYEKWGISYSRWPWRNYPDYVRGPCNIFSGRAVGLLLAAAQVTPYYHIAEDVYTTGIIAEKAGVTVWRNEW